MLQANLREKHTQFNQYIKSEITNKFKKVEEDLPEDSSSFKDKVLNLQNQMDGIAYTESFENNSSMYYTETGPNES